jgi:isopropylmalate/homocitrate/citramalate synthase
MPWSVNTAKECSEGTAMSNLHKKITLRDATLREGLDTPTVNFSLEQKLIISRLLDRAGIPEIEIAAPGNFLNDLVFAEALAREGLDIKKSGLIYAGNPSCPEQIEKASMLLDRVDILMPLSPARKPYDYETKIRLLLEALEYGLAQKAHVGVGFPHATQVESAVLLEIGGMAVKKGADRVTVYDTNGSSDPFFVHDLIKKIKKDLSVPVFFHGHNDLGLAGANSLAAVYAGAEGLDLTVNGLGDRAGNASLEQLAMALYLRGFETGISLKGLVQLSKAVEKESGIPQSKLAPVAGEFVFSHKSPGHMEHPELFEAFDPGLIGRDRALIQR